MTIKRINFNDGYTSEVTPTLSVPAGKSIYTGTAVPLNTQFNNGDVYLRSNGDIYVKVAGSWVIEASLALPATAISNSPLGNLVSTDQQAVNNELQSQIDTIVKETSVSLTNNQTTFASITGLAFSSATIRSFEAHVAIEVNATSSLFQSYKLMGINDGTNWWMNAFSVGDNAGINFDITNAGQVVYKSSNYPGFISGKILFSATTLTKS